jgi:hypothetical protein
LLGTTITLQRRLESKMQKASSTAQGVVQCVYLLSSHFCLQNKWGLYTLHVETEESFIPTCWTPHYYHTTIQCSKIENEPSKLASWYKVKQAHLHVHFTCFSFHFKLAFDSKSDGKHWALIWISHWMFLQRNALPSA